MSDETMSDNEFKSLKIGDMGEVITGTTPPTERDELFGKKYPFITPGDINNGERYASLDRFLSEAGKESQSNKLLPKDSVCFTCIGATIGKICMTDEPSFTNQQINSVVVYEDEHDPFYIFYLLKNNAEKIKKRASGAATPIVNKTSFSSIKLKVPPLPKQNKIGSILSTFDDLIENNKRRTEILEEMAETIYREWFVNFNFPGSEDVGMKNSEIGLIPENFELKVRDEIVERINSREDPNELPPDTPYVGLGDIPEKDIAMKDWGEAEEVKSAKYRFKPYDILFAKLRPYLHKCVFAPIEGIVSTDAFVFRPRKEHYYGWALMHLSSEEFVGEANTNTKGTNRPRANWKALKKGKVPFPPESLLVKFDKIVCAATSLTQKQIFGNKALQKTRNLLLPRLISGEIDLKGG